MSESKNNLFIDLNPQQIDAVNHIDGTALVVAGPGSGKTRVLTHRIANLIKNHNISETNILCVTFTNKAADEIKQRVGGLVSESFKLPWSGTFHSVCSKILRRDGFNIGIPPSFVIYDTDDSVSVIKEIIKDFGIDSKRFNPRGVLETISSAKSEIISAEDYEGYAQGYYQRTVAKIYPEYRKRLQNSNALDFDDLLYFTVKLFDTDPKVLEKYQALFKYILVDEYQDTNKAQAVLTRQLSELSKYLFVVGDMSQAIYSFRGADFRNILNFQRDYQDAVIYNLGRITDPRRLFRCLQKLLLKIIPLYKFRGYGQMNHGALISLGNSGNEEVAFVVDEISDGIKMGKSFNDFAVLYRTNAQSRAVEEALIKNSIPYRMFGGVRFYSRKEIKDIVSYLRVVHNPKDAVSWARIINTPTRGVGQKTAQKLKESGWDLEEIESVAKIPIKKWISKKDNLSTTELMDGILHDTGYLKWIDDGTEDALNRIENIKELRTVASLFVELDGFLESVSLVESVSESKDTFDNDRVTLLTAHASKGLEFPTVFIVGMEEGLFPHSNSTDNNDDLEEERRLCYVAITRAKNKVFITNARSRLYFGNIQTNLPSRFISEIPENLIDFKGLGFNNHFRKNKSEEDFLDDLEYDRNSFSWE